jgi:hypothetical protein
MAMLIDGTWSQQDNLVDAEGHLQRPVAAFRNWVTVDGAPGPTGSGGFKAEPGRYHLYVARACPWAHRTTIFREIKGLQSMIGLSVTHWLMADNGWTFEPGPGVVADPLQSTEFICYTNAATPTTPDAPRFPFFGIRTPRRSSATNLRRSFACSTVRSTISAPAPGTTTPSICTRRSTPSTLGYTTPSTTACTRPGLLDRRLSTMRRSAAFSGRSSGWKISYPGNVSSVATY